MNSKELSKALPSSQHEEEIDEKPNEAQGDFRVSDDNDETKQYRRLLRKMDMRIIPILAALYLLSFLDRGNIGNANIQGLSKDIGLVGNQYNWCLTVFFFPYCFFEPVCNALLVKFRPSIWLPSIMVAWGVVMTLTGLVQGYSGLLAARFFLGLTEAGLFPGITFYISLWYTRADAQLRMALVFASASVAGAFSGLLAYGIVKMDGVGGLYGWRWIFILEGLLTVLVAFSAFWIIPDEPATANFLDEREKSLAIMRLRIDRPQSTTTPQERTLNHQFKWKFVWAAFTDWQTLFHCLGYWGNAVAVYAVSLFLPTIINGLGYSAEHAQLLTVPIYVAASICCIAVGYYSDKTQKRGLFVFISYAAVFVGFLLAVAPSSFIPGLTYAGCFIAACGIYPAFPGLLTLSANNYAPNAKRATGMAIQIGFGTMGGAAASNFYHKQDAPRYRLGHSLVLGFNVLGLVSMVVYYLICRRINKKRDARWEAISATYTDEHLIELGDKAPNYKYTL
ncbi:hypothetical protein A1O3_02748 [Capronia epimyces CBS 606.96]|uniref:Major facilitator superfamily (MFS) profile domain-containing protein n=1 Tax=Capronia epimyces CBS 606.96 TaxID=1182542 RepID=W9YKA6_9EURO|nr:uncharacterized protein A1O3_02748 [Capronia epimyces CBS 606.96]EXJ89681.1 hypothetical protein A1O3_02748 [Capronia epimyces CBS 606.96]